MLISSLNAGAQGYANGLSADSIDPASDAQFIARTRAKMDEIRRREKRPIVALVLSGGGAKGAAEAGALKYLEEQGIPIDMVCGTSIGGMIGGMIATGYKSDDIREVFLTQDWSFTLTDRVDQAKIPYSFKQYNSEYVIAIPFDTKNYDESVFTSQGAMRTKSSFNAITRSLPSGYAYGLNVNNLISSLTVGYHDDQFFSEFPVPYVSVAADVVTSKAKNWGSGSIQNAMRSTMSIPGLFDPVRVDEMVLVDGGVRNNFPTDIAKAMGADFIIGIDLSDARKGYSDVNNIGNILFEFISMLGADSFNRNIEKPDVLIKPSIPEFNMLSFNREAIDTMLARGYNAALAKADEIEDLRSRIGPVRKMSTKPRAVNIANTSVTIGSIEYRGVSEKDAIMLEKITGLHAGAKVGKKDMDEAMAKLQGTGTFDNIYYSLYGSGEPYSLVFHCKTVATSRLGFGLRMDSEEWASFRFSLGFNTRKLTGPRFELDTKLGQNLSLNLRGSYASPFLPTVNLEMGATRYKGDLSNYLFDDDESFGIAYWTNRGRLYFSDIRWLRANFETGIKAQSYGLQGNNFIGIPTAIIPKERIRGTYLGAFANIRLYTLDSPYYPKKGVSLLVKTNYDFAKTGVHGFHPILHSGIDFMGVIPAGQKLAFIPKVNISNIYGNTVTNDAIGKESIIHSNFIGGAMAGRYSESQVPFFAINNVMIAQDMLASFVLETRYNPSGSLFLSAMAGAFNTSDTIKGMVENFVPHTWGAGLEAGFDSVIGPLKMNLHWSNASKWGLYVSMGYDF